MGRDFEPFEVIKEDHRTILRLRGSESKPALVTEDKVQLILDALVEGWDVEIKYAIIEGGLDLSTIAERLNRNSNGRLDVKGNINIWHSEFCDPVYLHGMALHGTAYFFSTRFKENVSFSGAAFLGNADFRESTFSMDVNFRDVVFRQDAYFWGAAFFGEAQFAGAFIERPASFADVKFHENTMLTGLWNNIFHPLLSPISRLFRVKLKKKTITTFFGLNTTMMDGASNPYLKRYIDDEQWIRSWRRRGNLRQALFIFWELTSHCGRSFGLWMFWAITAAIIFGAVYADYTVPSWLPQPLKVLLIEIDPEVVISSSERIPTVLTPYYFSIVTFTTLGFGDVHPMNLAGEIWLVFEVLLGYIMLGGLISIFANKFARRS